MVPSAPPPLSTRQMGPHNTQSTRHRGVRHVTTSCHPVDNFNNNSIELLITKPLPPQNKSTMSTANNAKNASNAPPFPAATSNNGFPAAAAAAAPASTNPTMIDFSSLSISQFELILAKQKQMDAVAASKAASHAYSADASPLQVNAPAFMMPSTYPEVGTNGKGVGMTSPQNVATMPSTAAGWHGALNPHLKTSILGAHEAQRRANLEDFDQQQDRFKYNFGLPHHLC